MKYWDGAPPWCNSCVQPSTFWDIGNLILPVLPGPPLQLSAAGVSWNAYPVTANLSNLQWLHSYVTPGTAGDATSPYIQLYWWAADHSLIGAGDFTTPNPGPVYTHGTMQLDANTAYMAAYAGFSAPAPTSLPPADSTFSFTANWYCGNTPGNADDCCPPDPSLIVALNNILDLVEKIEAQLQSGGSTGWADSTAHPGLSGQGGFQLGTGVTGVRATFTTIPPDIRITPGTPPFYWSLGFVTPVAVDVPLRSLRTVFQTQAMSLPPQTTQLDYTFPPGVVVTLTELTPA